LERASLLDSISFKGISGCEMYRIAMISKKNDTGMEMKKIILNFLLIFIKGLVITSNLGINGSWFTFLI
jgi:hypothetical protein